jgi:hypothetical protein
VTALVWRLHRNQVATAAAGLALLAIVLFVTGARMAGDYQSAVTACGGRLCPAAAAGLFGSWPPWPPPSRSSWR